MVRAKGRKQAGFTLIELLAVMAILGILAGLVAGTVTGLGNRGQATRLDGDREGIGKAANAFALEAFPEAFPIEAVASGVTGNVAGIHEIDFKTGLPQDPNKTFVPNFLNELPDSSALVSWRIDTSSGNVFFAQAGSDLIKPSNNRLDVSAETGSPSAKDDYLLEFTMAKDEAAPEIVVIRVPAGYTLAGGQTAANVVVGILTASLDTDNSVDPGNTITFGGVIVIVDTDTWALVMEYNDYVTTGSVTGADVKPTAGATRVHVIDVVRPSSDSAGTLTIDIERGPDDAASSATETWKLTLFGEMVQKLDSFTLPTDSDGIDTLSSSSTGLQSNRDLTNADGFSIQSSVSSITTETLIANPSDAAVYRWLAEEHTTISPVFGDTQFFSNLPGNQGVLIK